MLLRPRRRPRRLRRRLLRRGDDGALTHAARGFGPRHRLTPPFPSRDAPPAAREEADNAQVEPPQQAGPSLRVEQDPALRAALQQSIRVGDALLKQEASELAKVASLAGELLDRETKTPAPPLACGAERDACASCYGANPDAPLVCRPQVDAFVRCVSKALEASM